LCVCVDFCRTSSLVYDSFLDSFECTVADEHRIEGQEIGVSLFIFTEHCLLVFIVYLSSDVCLFILVLLFIMYSYTKYNKLLYFPFSASVANRSVIIITIVINSKEAF